MVEASNPTSLPEPSAKAQGHAIRKIQVTPGVHWVEIPEAELYIMCGSPPDAIKHLMRRGLIVEEEVDGVVFENGPNAVLLSDVMLQGGSFANLSEFPVLQMFYRQRMIVPGHPGNTGRKPILIGIEEQVKAQQLYLSRQLRSHLPGRDRSDGDRSGYGSGDDAHEAALCLRRHPRDDRDCRYAGARARGGRNTEWGLRQPCRCQRLRDHVSGRMRPGRFEP